MATIIETNHKANSIAINLPIIVSEYWLYRQMCRLIFKYILLCIQRFLLTSFSFYQIV